MLIADLALFLVSCTALVISGIVLVKCLGIIARFLQISEFLVAFILMAFSTSIPELFVGISSALAKNTALILGTVIGSNIADLTLVIGVAILLARGLKIESSIIKTDSLFMFLLALLPMGLMIIGNKISRFDGVILLAFFLSNQWRMIRSKRYFTKILKDETKRWMVVLAAMLFLLGIIFLYISSQFVVKYATLLSLELAIPPIIIGLFFVAIGTSLPELVFESSAAIAKKPGLALGDCIGSVIANSTLVLGVSALIYPITANFILFLTSGLFMLLIILFFTTLVESTRKISWKWGLTLIMFYIFFIIVELQLKGLVLLK